MIVACDDQFVIDGLKRFTYPDVLRRHETFGHEHDAWISSLTKQKADRFFSELDGCNHVVGRNRHAHYDSNSFVHKSGVISIRR